MRTLRKLTIGILATIGALRVAGEVIKAVRPDINDKLRSAAERETKQAK